MMPSDREKGRGLIPDQEERNLIFSELDKNILVEASAGTGKTTGMVGRMLALLASGKCQSISNMAAVTFTRKAAAELRSRFNIELEQALKEVRGEELDRLEKALSQQEECFIGTIHAFCARLLRERPVEAGIDLTFEEIDEEADRRLREEAWDVFTADILEDDPQGLLVRLHDLGLKLSDLKTAFVDFANFPDVEEWPVPDRQNLDADLDHVRQQLEDYVSRMKDLAPLLPVKTGNDTLIPQLARLPRVISHYQELENPGQLMQVLALFDREVDIVQKIWKQDGDFTAQDAKDEKGRWDAFRQEVVSPNLGAWRQMRYAIVMRLLLLARDSYDMLRKRHGVLNFQDLLMKAARLVRENPAVRRYLQLRFTHLLVDEFQDTDPIQAEVIVLLTSQNSAEKDWRKATPRPGSLFVVGDPKQSIYRFRRADITTYNEVKQIIASGGGLVVRLCANFRANERLLDWVNDAFEPGQSSGAESDACRFPLQECPESPSYIRLLAGKKEHDERYPSGVFRLEIPQVYTRKEEVIAFEADIIARAIKETLDGKTRVPPASESQSSPQAAPREFMIIARNTASLPAYARALRKYGIPCQVAGGSGLSEIYPLKLLNLCLKAIAHPDDPVALVAVLRSELFGLGDDALYSFKKAGGTFCFQTPPPARLSPDLADSIDDAFRRLRSYYLLTFKIPLLSAIEMMATDLGITALAAAEPGGNSAAGGLLKALELLREAQAEMWSIEQAVEFLERLSDREGRHDAGPVFSKEDCVRVMNLHKAKGLEAPVVFLADPYGASEHEIDRHIDRSGDEVLGYLAIFAEGNAYGRRGELLAHPAGWELLADKERGFLRAEELRLAYVAATRSCRATIISQKAKNNGWNPWRRFEAHLPPGSELPDPRPQSLAAKKPPDISLAEISKAEMDISKRLKDCLKPSYAVSGAKEFALSRHSVLSAPVQEPSFTVTEDSGGEAQAGRDWQGEDGIVLGEIIHALMEAAIKTPSADLQEMAASALLGRGIAPKLAPLVLKMVEGARASSLWKRAMSAPRRLTEVPFQTMLEGGASPTLLRGAVDLAFWEPDGWVLVDYKTDRTGTKTIDTMLNRYRPQMELYAWAWEKCSGEPVKERLIYFLEAGVVARIG